MTTITTTARSRPPTWRCGSRRWSRCWSRRGWSIRPPWTPSSTTYETQGRAAQRRPRRGPRLDRPGLSGAPARRRAPPRSPSSATRGGQGEHMVAVENTADASTTSSSAPCAPATRGRCWACRRSGTSPPPYRSRAVIDPRGVLAEFGLELPEDIEVRVWDSTAEVRYLVIPERPGRDRGARRGRARRPGHPRRHDRDRAAVNGVHDMGGMHGLGPVAPEPDEPVFHARLGSAGSTP